MTDRPNKAFLAKAIDRAQHMVLGEGQFISALHEYISGSTRIVWDDGRALFFVEHPQGWQVAVWMMPVASAFEPNASAAK